MPTCQVHSRPPGRTVEAEGWSSECLVEGDMPAPACHGPGRTRAPSCLGSGRLDLRKHKIPPRHQRGRATEQHVIDVPSVGRNCRIDCYRDRPYHRLALGLIVRAVGGALQFENALRAIDRCSPNQQCSARAEVNARLRQPCSGGFHPTLVPEMHGLEESHRLGRAVDGVIAH